MTSKLTNNTCTPTKPNTRPSASLKPISFAPSPKLPGVSGAFPSLENNIFAIGAIELADEYKDHDPTTRAALVATATFLKYERQIRNLNLQEARLWRRREKETAELRQLQEERRAMQQAQSETATNSSEVAASAQLAENGFEFPSVREREFFHEDFACSTPGIVDATFFEAA